MFYKIGVQNNTIRGNNQVSFGKKEADKKSVCENHDRLLVEEMDKHPISTSLKINAEKLTNAFVKYPIKGFKGSKNANFYQFLQMGTVPYLLGSAAMMAVFNLARIGFNTPNAKSAAKLGNKMALGVAFYGIMKNLSKKFIELPVKHIRGIDVNMPYDKIVYELPEKGNENNLVQHENHKAFESVDFPRWDLFYNNEYFGDERNSYYKKVSEKFGYDPGEIDHSDQKMKSVIKETVVKTKLFTTLSSYFWAASAVGVAMQEPWEKMLFNPIQRLRNLKDHAKIKKVMPDDFFVIDFAKKLGKSFGEFIGVDFGKIVKNLKNHEKITKGLEKATKTQVAGRVLFGAALGLTVLGNFFALNDFSKDKGSKTQASTSLIDDSREKVVC